MRKIAHLSDLHFGATDPVILPALTSTIRAADPDVIVVSGDLTQRARNREFEAAGNFLATLAYPRIVVPGNHDVPLYNIFMRAFHPLSRYRRYFGEELTPFHADDEIAIVGVNTARSMTFKDGRINREQVSRICERLQSLGEDITKIIVTHHPFEGTQAQDRHGLVGRATMAMAGFSSCRIDLILSGHLHASRIGLSASRYDLDGYSALLIQAGTATSTRRREEPNSFNLISITRPHITVERWTWDSGRGAFAVSTANHFLKTDEEWSSAADVEGRAGRHYL
jgi:3',5'-cyclic AMP phosphodiesterase CpdA